ncbi:probable 28S ribosomal protein S6, mitochondrial [Spodoptera frugiperda]|uniref:Small ribosomal subunit protein bS6m n=1 Tax=Spodoptera frugiperda TaxID=7108 RepID=Q95UN1_SPOFR|nr:probable 28S ribosomal protein S6, mitochondrial [Spodoptera frugiperda]AAL03955.1 28S ribosomal protein S6 precursor [Spodoptera frugiperda]
MPTYEVALMLRSMPKPELKTTLKRISHAIFDRGGIIRNIENLGHRPMPYKTSAHGLVHREANYFVFKIDTATKAVSDLKEEYSRDVDVIRQRVFKCEESSSNNCTLEEELLPPAYRDEVKKMIEVGKTQVNRFTYKFKYNSGLDYYPFQK